MDEILGAAISYLYGSIPFAYIATSLLRSRDLRREGTGNIGVTSAFKVGGTAAGVCAVGGEISKAIVPLWIAREFFPDIHYAKYLFLFCALAGTSFSVFLKGRGGKGSTTALWGMLILSPYACIVLTVVWYFIVRIARDSMLIKKIPLILIPVVIHLAENDPLFTMFGALTAILMFVNSLIRKDDFIHYGVFRKQTHRKTIDI